MNFCKIASLYSLWGICAQVMVGKGALLDQRQLRLQRLNHASTNLLQTPLKDGFLSSPSFFSYCCIFMSCLPFSPHSQSTKFKTEVSRTQFFLWVFSQCWCEILINLCLQYISYSSLTWTWLEYSKAALWSLLLQGPSGFSTEQPQSCFSAEWSGSTWSSWHLK